jgi:hypothetical protein
MRTRPISPLSSRSRRRGARGESACGGGSFGYEATGRRGGRGRQSADTRSARHASSQTRDCGGLSAAGILHRQRRDGRIRGVHCASTGDSACRAAGISRLAITGSASAARKFQRQAALGSGTSLRARTEPRTSRTAHSTRTEAGRSASSDARRYCPRCRRAAWRCCSCGAARAASTQRSLLRKHMDGLKIEQYGVNAGAKIAMRSAQPAKRCGRRQRS